MPMPSVPGRRLVVALAAVQATCVGVGAVAAATHSDSTHHPAPVQQAQSTPTPEVTRSAQPPHGLVVGPAETTTSASSARADLVARTVRLNPALATQVPDALVDGGFRTLHKFLEQFPVGDRGPQRLALRADGFQGSEFHSWLSSDGKKRYLVDLTRFASSAGATHHLAGFVEGGLHQAAESITPTGSTVHGGLAFFRPSPTMVGREFVQYETRGRYFCLVIVRSTDTSVSHAALKRAGATLAQAQRARMSGSSAGAAGSVT
ncbi:MAG TPA: hypothetical protein VG650_00930 [Mycobacteriales bacterium]|nr:hypothetical protein [Mycobacteriales bacterium]